MEFVIIAIVILAIIIIISCIKIVPQAHAYIVERLGAYQATWSVGLHFKMPFLDKVAKRVLLKEQVVDFPPQPVITKDNVTMQIDTVVFFQITDPKLFTYGVESPMVAIENLTATTLRNIIGDLELDQTLTSRETINTKMRATLDEATDPWGIKVTRVELKNIMPPTAIRDAMEKQMKAERERREAILKAEGEKKSTILVAEGKKESVILEAEAEKQSAILRAEAEKEKKIREAEGEAEAILLKAKAEAEKIKLTKLAEAEGAKMMAEAKKIEMQAETENLANLARADVGDATMISYVLKDQWIGMVEAEMKKFEHINLGTVTVVGGSDKAADFMGNIAKVVQGASGLGSENVPGIMGVIGKLMNFDKKNQIQQPTEEPEQPQEETPKESK